MTRVRFQADADLNSSIINGVLRREPFVDFQTAVTANLIGRSDPEVLAFAAVEGRILISHDRKTMSFHFAEFISTQTSSGLVIVSKKMLIQNVIDELILIWAASDAEEWVNRIVYLPN